MICLDFFMMVWVVWMGSMILCVVVIDLFCWVVLFMIEVFSLI